MDLFLQGFWLPLWARAISYPPLMLAMCALPLFAFLLLLLRHALGLFRASACSQPAPAPVLLDQGPG